MYRIASLILGFILCLAVFSPLQAQSTSQAALFLPASSQGFDLSSNPYLSLNPSIALTNSELTFLIDNQVFVAQLNRLYPHPTDLSGFVWAGKIQDLPYSQVTLVKGGDRVYVSIATGTSAYEISPVGGDVYELREVSAPHFEEDDGIPVPMPANQTNFNPSIDIATAENPVQIDVMLAYTPQLLSLVGSDIEIINRYASEIAKANQAFADSQIYVTLNIIDTFLTASYNGTAYDSDEMIGHVQNPNDGFLDDVAARRATIGADIVTLLSPMSSSEGDSEASGGTAYVPRNLDTNANRPYGYHVLNEKRFSSIPHEIGHNLGMWHNIEDSAPITRPEAVFPYAFGYRIPGVLRTYMSYSCAPDSLPECPWIPYFANPNVNYQGTAIGTANENAALTINQTAGMVASYYNCALGTNPEIVDVPAGDSQALLNAFATFGCNTVSNRGIRLAPNSTYTLNTALPNTFKTITVNGQGSTLTFTGNIRPLTVPNDVNWTLRNLTLVGGQADNGGQIYNQGQVTLENVTLTGGQATNEGGSIVNWASMTISNSQLQNGTAFRGGLISNWPNATLTLSNSQLHQGTSTEHGGALFNHANAIVSGADNQFNANLAQYGGGLSNGGVLDLTNSSFSTNQANYGGGLYNYQDMTLTGSTFSTNQASLYGGSIYNSGNLTVRDSWIDDSQAVNIESVSYGGAIYQYAVGSLILERNLFTNNSADYGGAVIQYSPTENAIASILVNNTFSGNQAEWGGAIAVSTGSMQLVGNTFKANTAPSASAFGAFQSSVTFTLGMNAIDGTCQLSGATVISRGYNIAANADCGLTGTGDLSNTNPQLGALSGTGRYQAHYPLAASPVINRVPLTACKYDHDNNNATARIDLGRDQWLDFRPYTFGGKCDAGAIEYGAVWDVNQDGQVSPRDVILILNRRGDAIDNANRRADVDRDGAITNADAQIILEQQGQ